MRSFSRTVRDGITVSFTMIVYMHFLCYRNLRWPWLTELWNCSPRTLKLRVSERTIRCAVFPTTTGWSHGAFLSAVRRRRFRGVESGYWEGKAEQWNANCSPMRVNAQLPLLPFVVDLLYNKSVKHIIGPNTNLNPDRWSGVRPAPVCVLIALEVLMAVVQSI